MSNTLDTKLSVKEIEDAIILHLTSGIRSNLIVPNVSWGMGINYEADLVVVSKSGYATEYEIKRSYYDFIADFRKDEKAHKAPWVYQFFYVLPLLIKDKVEAFIENARIEPPAIFFYDEAGRFSKSNVGYSYVKGGRKMFLEEQLRLARLGVMRYWGLRSKEKELL